MSNQLCYQDIHICCLFNIPHALIKEVLLIRSSGSPNTQDDDSKVVHLDNLSHTENRAKLMLLSALLEAHEPRQRL